MTHVRQQDNVLACQNKPKRKSLVAQFELSTSSRVLSARRYKFANSKTLNKVRFRCQRRFAQLVFSKSLFPCFNCIISRPGTRRLEIAPLLAGFAQLQRRSLGSLYSDVLSRMRIRNILIFNGCRKTKKN